ncbi:hypothetical protein QCA50_003421 [Cerrena zonata]|uniref:F-box domain-containing protein n=1 Tax=Cerrena zonata TaxID=2478898 RepID=A0AAW0GW94_9APHY
MIAAQEIFDSIVDYLHDDKDALRSCSLVSKSLLDASYHHLFGNLEVKITDNLTTRTTKRQCQLWDEFFTFITSNARAVKYIRQLCIDMVDAPSILEYEPKSYKDFPAVPVQHIVHILDHAPSLRHLNLYHLHIIPKPINAEEENQDANVHRLRSLALCWCVFDDISLNLPDFLRVTNACKVTLHHIRCATLASQNNPYGGPPSLSPSPPSHQDILPNYTLHIQCLQIIGACRLFHYTRDDEELLSAIPSLMSRIYSSLREFTLVGASWHGPKDFRTVSRYFSLQKAHKLQSAVIFCALDGYSNTPRSVFETWDPYVSFLSSLPPSTEHIRIDVFPINQTNIVLPDITVSRNLLLHFPSLRPFTLRCALNGLESGDESVGTISSQGTGVDKDNIMRVEYCRFETLYHDLGAQVDFDHVDRFNNPDDTSWA